VRTYRLLAVGLAAMLVLPTVVTTLPEAAAQTAPEPIQEGMGCDTLDPSLCLFPFPNDAFTVADADTQTGRRLDFELSAMPRNGTDVTTPALGGEGKPVDPTEWNRNDGFSPGQAALTYVPGLDLHETWGTTDRPVSEAGENEHGYFDHRDHIADIGLYERADAPIVILNADTGERHPFWSELDSHHGASDARRALILRPAVNYDHGARYIVALRNLRDGDGELIEAGAAFAAFRDGEATGDRAEHMEEIFGTLADAGIDREELYLAWDFTVISQHNMASGSSTSATTPSAASSATPTWPTASSRATHRSSRSTAPRSATTPGPTPAASSTPSASAASRAPSACPTTSTARSRSPRPTAHRCRSAASTTATTACPSRTRTSPGSTCRSPATSPSARARPTGRCTATGCSAPQGQIGDVKWPRRYGFNGCGVDWWGMSTLDLPTVAIIIADLSNFPSLPDRAQQGFLNFMFLGRAMVHPDGFVTDEAFQDSDGSPLIVTDAGTRAPSCSSTATARAGSWAARSWRSPPTSPAGSSACPA
jgi:hypothetical protein